MTWQYVVLALGIAAAFVINSWIIAREIRKTAVRGINAGARMMGAAEDVVTDEDLAEARKLDDLSDEVS